MKRGWKRQTQTGNRDSERIVKSHRSKGNRDKIVGSVRGQKKKIMMETGKKLLKKITLEMHLIN